MLRSGPAHRLLRLRWRNLPILPIVLGLLLAAGLPTTAAPASQQPGQPGPLRIGAAIGQSGTYAQLGGDQSRGYVLWSEQVNAAGGILGRPVELILYDDESDPETSVRMYEKLVIEDKVDLILSPYSSLITIPVNTFTQQYGFPLVAAGASANDVWTRGDRYVFGVYALAQGDMDGAIALAIENGYRTAAIINETTTFPRSTADGAEERAIEAGLQVVAREEFGPEDRDLTPFLARIRALNPDVLMAGTFDTHATLIVRQLKELNWAPKLLALNVGPALPGFYDELGADSDYVFGASQWGRGVTSPGNTEFVASYEQRFGREPGYTAAAGFASGQLLQEAIELTRSFDKERIRDALAALETSTVLGPYRVDETGAQVAKPSYLVQWLDGESKIVWPSDLADGAYVVPMPPWDGR